jgi:hypothetical protein
VVDATITKLELLAVQHLHGRLPARQRRLDQLREPLGSAWAAAPKGGESPPRQAPSGECVPRSSVVGWYRVVLFTGANSWKRR